MVKPLIIVLFLLLLQSIYAQDVKICSGSQGDPIINITFGSGGNSGKSLTAIDPEASTTYNFTPVFGSPVLPLPLDGRYAVTNNLPHNPIWFSGATDHTGDQNDYMAFFNTNPTCEEYFRQTVNNILPSSLKEQCSNWLNILSSSGGFTIGDLDVSGQQLTVEATFNRTQPFSQPNELYAGDLVSKHCGPTNTNYLLRPNTAEITTDQGYFRTPDICNIQLNKTYHVAMTYDGTILKFYRNGFLMSSVPASGNLYQNDLLTTIGNLACQPGFGDEELLGYINEVRIWRTVRTQAQLNEFLNQPLPDPAIQNGLLAYYSFNDLKNKQGNKTWDGTLINGAVINQINPTCNSYVIDSCEKVVTTPIVIVPSFTAPDTVCVNTPVHINNTTTGAGSYYWSFCTADLKNTVPESVNLGNIDGSFAQPVFTDLVSDNGKYYVFLTNHFPGSLVRLDFGNSYLNTPTATNLGNFSGIIPAGYGTEGIQVVKNEGKWYAFIVAGSPPNNVASRLIKIELGTFIENSAPIATDWGDIGNIGLPIDFYMFKDKQDWYGFSVNAEGNTITRFAFTNSFDNIPVGENLGNINNLFDYPTGIYVINNEGNWNIFVINATSGNLVRLDFGTSLLNMPTGVNLGNPDNTLNAPRDLTIVKSCESVIGYVVNGISNDIVRLDFNNNILSTPSGISLGNLGELSFPHSISKFFRVQNDVYSFITNVNNNTITRLKFGGCKNSNISGTSLQNPADITYNAPGIYNINLTIDEGLPTEAVTCHQVVVLAPPLPHSTIDTSFCSGSNIQLTDRDTSNSDGYLWNTGATTKNIEVFNSGKYWVTTDTYGCKSTDSFQVAEISAPLIALGKDTVLCIYDSITVYAKNEGSTYLWQDGSKQNRFNIEAPGVYSVAVTNETGCVGKDSITIEQLPSPVLSVMEDKAICKGDSTQLAVIASDNSNTYIWQYDPSLSSLNIADPLASPAATTKYYVTVKNQNGCMAKDSVRVDVLARPFVSIRNDTTICNGDVIPLTTSAANASTYTWTPSESLNSNSILSPNALPPTTTTYNISAGNGICNTTDNITITIKPLPIVKANNDTTICGTVTAQLYASGANSYTWFPANGLNNAVIQNPTASPRQTTLYRVKGVADNGCANADSVRVVVAPAPVFSITPPKANVCLGDSILVKAAGGDIYAWAATPDVDQLYSAETYIKPAINTAYKLTVTNSVCKVSKVLTVSLFTASKPIIHALSSNDIDCAVNNTVLTSTGGVSYTWSPANSLINANTSSPVATPTKTTVYIVKGKNADGCINEDSVVVNVNIANVDNGYKMASAFTPNNDGINDCFGVRNWSIVSGLDFTIYDRWGMRLFHSNNVSDCWDGKYKGIQQPVGTYVYQIKAKTFCGNIYKKGTVVLLH